jgi:hypothetical protein
MKSASLIALLMSLVGCGQVSRELHPWQSPGDVFSFRVDTTEWTVIEPRRLGRVTAEHVAEACDFLKETDAVEITSDRARQMCPAAQFDFSSQLKPFLIRGVSYGSPSYSIVKFDKQSGWVCFLQATWNGETYIAGVRHSPIAAPIVILLEDKPAKVVAIGNVGGDGMFRGVDLRNTWNERHLEQDAAPVIAARRR